MREERDCIVRQACKSLPRCYRAVLLWHAKGLSLSRIATKAGFSRQRAHAILSIAREKVARRLFERGIVSAV